MLVEPVNSQIPNSLTKIYVEATENDKEVTFMRKVKVVLNKGIEVIDSINQKTKNICFDDT